MLDIKTIKQNVSTKPCFDGGANFKTHYLAKTSRGYAFKASIGAILFTLIFIIVGISLLVGGCYYLIINNEYFKYLMQILVGSVFSAAGFYFLFHFFKPRVFNKNTNRFYKGFGNKDNRHSKSNIPLNNIIALQIIGETIEDDDGHYKSFEINLVLNDASRINVVDHGNLDKIIDDAEILSEFLNIPIWHAKSNKT
ncbi:hypothetical protein [Lacinutrix mariniflava]|uniref:hypothetical protein n=1 Tax=Lacinutrix mariniflava TaxID=342955 RepID=UPI0006E26356|nr:hypothetical protein [Lacinutrix mariniflava]